MFKFSGVKSLVVGGGDESVILSADGVVDAVFSDVGQVDGVVGESAVFDFDLYVKSLGRPIGGAVDPASVDGDGDGMRTGRDGKDNVPVFSRGTVDAFYASRKLVRFKLSDEEQEAVGSYIEAMYRDINDFYRNGSRSEAELAETFDTAYKKASISLGKEEFLYRGWEITSNSDSRDWIPNLKVGDVIEDKGFVSASSEERVAKDFANVLGESGRTGSVIFRIKAPRGTKVLAGNADESELILYRGTKTKVTKVDMFVRGEKQNYEIELEVVS